MVKFTCLYSRILSMKPKKTIERSAEAMHKTLEDCVSNNVKSSQGDYLNDLYSKSEGNNSNYSSQQDIGVHFSDKIRKSISLGSGLGGERRASVGSDSESEKGENDDVTIAHEALPSDLRINESIFSIGNKPFNPPLMSKSKSLQNICSSTHIVAPHSRSVDDLTALDSGIISKKMEYIDLDTTKGGCDSYEHVNNQFHGESSLCTFEIMTNKDYKIKRIEDWVYDLQNCSPLEETDDDNQILGGSKIVNNSISAKCDDKLNAGVEVAKRYISSLSPSATAVYLANHGLVVVPLLSAFVTLRTLNLSGNFIVKITVGALPRALHDLNLSKNSITTIEGLRGLTRLRVLDLSYNRIVRIGHGLASCTSLKELYLSGNKISEVEGLHRLLKINVLDLRFNKISTAKSLGQLAANYHSLQAISLEGNPSQKNVGDEKIKKYLQGLLPLLSYYNTHNIKAKSLADASDRSARLGSSSRGLRSDHKGSRKRSCGVSPHNKSTSFLPKASKGKAGRLPPTEGKAVATNRNKFNDFGSKVLGFESEQLTRSRSEGTLGAL